MNKTIWFILFLIIACVACVLSFQYLLQPTTQNGFTREVKQDILQQKKIFNIPHKSMYFIGSSSLEKDIYLKDFSHRNEIYSIDENLSFLLTRSLKLPKDSVLSENRVTVGVNGIYMHISNNQSGSLSVINNNSNKTSNHRLPDVTWMDQVNILSDYSIIGRNLRLDGKFFKRELIKFNYNLNKTIKKVTIKRKYDGAFCTDGMLKLDVESGKIFYMFFFRGEFMCLDSNINLNYIAKTIDTITIRNISTSHIKNGKGEYQKNSVKLSKPIKAVNKSYALYQNYIYLLSAIKGDSESNSDFKNNQVVDVYNQKTGKYIYSFYIPNYKGEKAQDLKITNNFLYAVYKSQLIKFQFKKFRRV